MSLSDTLLDALTDDNGDFRLPRMQSVIAGTLTVVVSFLWLTGGDVPEGLLNVYLIVIGFFFGDRNGERRAQAEARSLPDPVSE